MLLMFIICHTFKYTKCILETSKDSIQTPGRDLDRDYKLLQVLVIMAYYMYSVHCYGTIK